MQSIFLTSSTSDVKNKLSAIINNVQYYNCNTVKTKNIYLAGPWFDEKSELVENAIYDIYKRVCTMSPYNIFRPKTEGQKYKHTEEVFESNICGIKNADLIIANISKSDVGTAFEIGYANALNKQVILLGYDESCFKRKTNLMLAYASNKCITIDKLHKVYTNTLTSNDIINTNKNWENIE